MKVIEAAGFVNVRIGSDRYDTFSGSASESSAASFGTRGVNLFGRKPA
jgi:hypothetical protein